MCNAKIYKRQLDESDSSTESIGYSGKTNTGVAD